MIGRTSTGGTLNLSQKISHFLNFSEIIAFKRLLFLVLSLNINNNILSNYKNGQIHNDESYFSIIQDIIAQIINSVIFNFATTFSYEKIFFLVDHSVLNSF